MYLVRDAIPSDALGIAEVHVRSWQTAYRGHMPDEFLDQLNVEQRARLWEAILSTGESLELVATDANGTIVGFASILPSRDADGEGALELAALYVVPERFRHGVGTLLMNAVDARSRDHDASAMTLWVLDSNERARRFYETHGFMPDGAEKLDDRFGDFTLREVRYRRT